MGGEYSASRSQATEQATGAQMFGPVIIGTGVGGSSGSGGILSTVLIVVAVALFGWLLFFKE